MKFGGEYIYVRHTGDWYIQSIGRYTMSATPATLGSLIPASAAMDPAQWNLGSLSPLVLRFDKNYSYTGWENIIDSPRPTYAIWFGDTWHVNNQLTVNYGIRYDADPNTASAPNVKTNSILIDPRVPSTMSAYRAGTGDYGYKKGIRDWKDAAPRAGFTYNLGGKNDFVVRGGTGLYYASPVSNVTFSPGVYSNLITATFPNDGRANFITNPTNSIPDSAFLNGSVPLPAQSPRVILESFRNPYTWQSSIGFQKQLNAVTGIEADLTHYNEYHDTRSIDPNLFYNPVTGYNAPVSAGRPNPAYGQVLAFTADGRKDQTQLSTGFTRRLQRRFQAGATYTLMLAMHDDGTLGYTTPSENSPFDYLAGEYRHLRRISAAHGQGVDAVSTALGILDERHVLLRLRQPLPGRDRRDAVRQDRQQSPERFEHRRRRRADHHSGGGARSMGRSRRDRVRRRDPAQRARGSAAAQGGSARHEGDPDCRVAQSAADWRDLQRLQPRQLRQLQHDAQRDQRRHDGAVRPAGAKHEQRVRAADGTAGVSLRLLTIRIGTHLERCGQRFPVHEQPDHIGAGRDRLLLQIHRNTMSPVHRHGPRV